MVINTSQQSTAHSPVRILLYTLITTANQQVPIQRTFRARLRNRLVRFAHLANWRLTGRWRGQFWQFEDVQNSNLGDIAVRLGVKQALLTAFAGRQVEFIEVPWGDLTPALIAKLHGQLDLIVIGGGGYLFLDREGKLPQRFLNDVAALRYAKCPVAATSVGINRLMRNGDGSPARFHPEQQEVVHEFVARLSVLSVRDPGSQRAFALAGMAPPPVVVDPGYLLADNQYPAIKRTGDSTIHIGLNLPFHGPFASSLSQHALTTLIRVLKKLSATTPCRFSYFCHADSGRGIVAALRAKGIQMDVFDGEVGRLLAGYGQLDVHLGAMMHSTIMAMSCGVPTIALAYDVKSAGFFELFGLGKQIIPVPTFNEEVLYRAVVDLIAQRGKIAADIASKDAQLRKSSVDFYSAIAERVSASGQVRTLAL